MALCASKSFGSCPSRRRPTNQRPSPPPPQISPIRKRAVGIDTRPVRSASELLSALEDKRPGDRVRCDVLRDGKRLSMTVLLGERVPGAVEE